MTLFLLQARMPPLHTAWLVLSQLPTSIPTSFSTVQLSKGVTTKMQELTLGLAEHHTGGLSPSNQLIQIPLQSFPPHRQIDTYSQHGVIRKLSEGALNPLILIIYKDIKQDWPQY